MLDERGGALPHARVSGDDEMGRRSWFRQELRSRGERYLLAVPSNTLVRDVTAPDAPYCGHGRRPRAPFVRADRWCATLAEAQWETIEVRDGEKGPLVVQAARALVQARTEGGAVGSGGDAGGLPRASRRRGVEARLPAVQPLVDDAECGLRPGVQGAAPGRGVPQAGQGRGGPGRLPGADVGRLAPPSGTLPGGDLVPDAGDQAGKKDRRRR